MPANFRPRRSVLYVPAINERALAKAASLACDVVILDLEDSVPPEMKRAARERARGALESGLLAGKEVVVRVNALPGGENEEAALEDLAEDLAAIIPAGPDAVLFPKIRFAADAARAEAALDAQIGPAALKLWLMIETPEAILDIAAIAGTGREPNSRLACLVMGTNDLAKEMRLTLTGSRLALLHALSATIVAARAHGLDVIDGVYADLADLAGFESEARQGKGLGFDGKTLIYPSQIEPANRLFSPSEGEVAAARQIIAAFEAPENAGRGVLVVDGKMTERLHYDMAKRTLAFNA